MSEEQDRDNTVVVVEQPASCQKSPFPAIEKQDTHKGMPAPAVPSLSLEIHKDATIHEMPSNLMRHDQFESVALTSLEIEKKRGVIIPSSYPIPPDVQSINSIESDTDKDTIKKVEDVSIAHETTEKQAVDTDEVKVSEWSDDEEAGGLPRSESRSSRISRAVRQLFCCGVAYEVASEENIPTPRRHYNEAI